MGHYYRKIIELNGGCSQPWNTSATFFWVVPRTKQHLQQGCCQARNYHAHAPRHGFVPRSTTPHHTPIALTKCWSVATIDEEAFFFHSQVLQVLQVQLVALFPPRNCHQNSGQIAGSGAVRPKDRGVIFKDSDALPAPTHPSDCFEIWSHKFEWEGSL